MSDILNASYVFLDNPATTVDEVLTFLSEQAVALGIADDAAAVQKALEHRESEGTTGMMAGYAIPHCKSAAIKKAAVLVVKFAGDVAWKSMDGAPIRVAISLLVPDGEVSTAFLKMLSQVAVMLMNEEFRTKIDATDDPDAIVSIIEEGFVD